MCQYSETVNPLKREPSNVEKVKKCKGLHKDEVFTWVLSRFGCVRLFETPWTVAHQAPLSMGLSRQEYWSGLPFCSPGDLPDPGIKPRSPALQADSLTSEPTQTEFGEKKVELFPIWNAWGAENSGS